MTNPPFTDDLRLENGVSRSDAWMEAQLKTVLKTPVDIVEECSSLYTARFSNSSESEIQKTLADEVVSDLTLAQWQPALRAKYRRYVVIKGRNESEISWDRDGV